MILLLQNFWELVKLLPIFLKQHHSETKQLRIPMRCADIEAVMLDGASVAYEIVAAPNNSFITVKAEATVLLGKAIVSIINLLSPDCILFSGGLSARDEYLNPVISYALDHCYSSGTLPVLKKAELGEDAPLIGAALVGANL